MNYCEDKSVIETLHPSFLNLNYCVRRSDQPVQSATIYPLWIYEMFATFVNKKD